MTTKLYKFRTQNKYFYGIWSDLKKLCYDNAAGWKSVKKYKRDFGHLLDNMKKWSKSYVDKFFLIDGISIQLWTPQAEREIPTWRKSKVSSSEVQSTGSSSSSSSSESQETISSSNQFLEFTEIMGAIKSMTLSKNEIASMFRLLTEKVMEL